MSEKLNYRNYYYIYYCRTG